MNDRKPMGDEPTCDKCATALQGGGTRPVDNVAVVVCKDHVGWADGVAPPGAEVIVRPTVADVNEAEQQ